jgi:hypothetical protein
LSSERTFTPFRSSLMSSLAPPLVHGTTADLRCCRALRTPAPPRRRAAGAGRRRPSRCWSRSRRRTAAAATNP